MSNPFSYDATRTTVHDSLASAFQSIPDGKRGALLVVADQDGARALLAARIGHHWQLAAGADKPWTGPVTGQVVIQGAW